MAKQYKDRYKQIVAELDWFPRVVDEWTTVRAIIDRKASIARFGDGEIKHCYGHANISQEANTILTKKINEVIQVNDPQFLVGIPRLWERRHFPYCEHQRSHWAKYFGHMTTDLLNRETQYYSHCITRPDMVIDIESDGYWEMCLGMWEGRDVVFAQGGKRPKHHMKEDFIFAKSNVIADIPGIPIRDAMREYDSILDKVLEACVPGCVVVLGIGPAATIMAYDVYKAGFQAIDTGHFVQFYHKNHKKTVNLELVIREEWDRLHEIERKYDELVKTSDQ